MLKIIFWCQQNNNEGNLSGTLIDNAERGGNHHYRRCARAVKGLDSKSNGVTRAGSNPADVVLFFPKALHHYFSIQRKPNLEFNPNLKKTKLQLIVDYELKGFIFSLTSVCCWKLCSFLYSASEQNYYDIDIDVLS